MRGREEIGMSEGMEERRREMGKEGKGKGWEISCHSPHGHF